MSGAKNSRSSSQLGHAMSDGQLQESLLIVDQRGDAPTGPDVEAARGRGTGGMGKEEDRNPSVDISGATTAGKAAHGSKSFRKSIYAFVALMLAVITYEVPTGLERHQQQTLAVVVLVCILWASEAIPVWVTSLLIPFLVVTCKILTDDDGNTKSASDAAKEELANLADPNVVLLMGGFTLALALNKYELDVRMATLVLSRAGTGPKTFLAISMVVSFVMSMFVNNVAAPVMCFFILSPIIYKIEDRAFNQCLIMGIAFACNLGGMPTPIASPQNAAALDAIHKQNEEVDFLKWMAFATPITVPALMLTWGWLLLYWRPKLQCMPEFEAPKVKALTIWHYYVAAICLLTIALWCSFAGLQDVFGKLGLIGLVPVIALYAPGVLETDDFNKMDWNVLMLLGGGASLGDAVKSSGLLESLANKIQTMFGEPANANQYLEFMFFCLVVMLVANCISHTVAAITMMPVVATVGAKMVPSRVVPYVLGSVLMDSAACGLPVSSFPNIIAYGIVDRENRRFMNATDYLKAGAGVQLVMLALMGSIGWFMMKAIL